MPNITLRVDEDIIKRVKKIAIEKNTTLTAMVREFLSSVAQRDESTKKRAVTALKKTFSRYSRPMGPKTWTRVELHER